MDQSLLTAHGAQPVKPSRYKPIWNDRYFTGYFTNRSPFRSPLSAFYADGWQLGKTDTLIDGVNVEVSPRLTLIRRPGCTAYTNTTLASPPLGFYSFHRQDGQITIVADTTSAIYTISPTAVTSIYTKSAGAGQATFKGVGNLLYWADGTTAKAWDATNPTASYRNMGMQSPGTNLGVSQAVNIAGSGISLAGFKPNTAYVSTANQLANPTVFSAEFWINCGANAGPILSFESAQTGASTTVYHTIYLDPSSSILKYAVLDASTNQMNVSTTNVGISDGNWHHVMVTVKNNSSIYQAVNTSPSGQPNASVAAGSQNALQDKTVSTNWTYNNTPTFSSGPTPPLTQVCFYIDGKLVMTTYPTINTYATGNGYWRIGSSSGWSGQSFSPFNGIISEMAIYANQMAGPADHFPSMVYRAVSNYEQQVFQSSPTYWWKLQETSGTVAADSGTYPHTVNNGTYQTGVTLNQSATIPYIPYVSNTSVATNKVIVDSNYNLQKCTTAGTTGVAQPTWAQYEGQFTTDGTAVWQCMGQATFHLSVGRRYTYCYVNANGHFSTAAPISDLTAPYQGSGLNIIGQVSFDPQITQIAIFAVPDGGVTPFYITSIPNPVPAFPTSNLWGFFDTVPDSQLNVLMAAPQAHSNDAPPTGITNFEYHLGRLWGSVGNTVYCSGGPDTLVGNGNEAWPPANSWSFPAKVNRLVAGNSGLLVFTTSSVYLLGGGPAVSQFYPQLLLDRVGLASYNALDTNGSQITLFTSDRQLITLDPSMGVQDIGFPIADKLQSFDPTKVYVVHHHSGQDNGLYIADGSTGWYRCVPQQPPDFSITGPVWSPNAQVIPTVLPLSGTLNVTSSFSIPTGAADALISGGDTRLGFPQLYLVGSAGGGVLTPYSNTTNSVPLPPTYLDPSYNWATFAVGVVCGPNSTPVNATLSVFDLWLDFLMSDGSHLIVRPSSYIVYEPSSYNPSTGGGTPAGLNIFNPTYAYDGNPSTSTDCNVTVNVSFDHIVYGGFNVSF